MGPRRPLARRPVAMISLMCAAPSESERLDHRRLDTAGPNPLQPVEHLRGGRTAPSSWTPVTATAFKIWERRLVLVMVTVAVGFGACGHAWSQLAGQHADFARALG